MEEINYVGEHLLPGGFGRFFIFLAFSSAFVSFIAYLMASLRKDVANVSASPAYVVKPADDQSWRLLGRWAFFVHAAAILGIVASLFYIIFNHYFEYQYAWQHSSMSLPMKYILACFWEGQEGSFLLWAFWHAVLGLILIFTSKKWEAPVLAIFAVTQVFLISMLLGVHIGDYKVGSNPFLLLRNVMPAGASWPATYLQQIVDGNGLNPLLQNYWMVIHPPVLFLGFASTIIPFAFVIAALWKRDYTGWVKPVVPWALFGCMILGVGILMGGAWAYESLTFGGFWAWDPVENASLVPWLCFIAGLHVLVAYRSTGHGLVITCVLFVFTFLLILYSTFLTRSGILGDTSVHSFTDLGMSGQLLVFMFFYIVLSLALLIIRWNEVPSPATEEKTSSREFWIFIATLVFAMSAIHITYNTSIPVINKIWEGISALFGSKVETVLAPPTDPIPHYNKFQVWIAIIVGLLAGFVQYLRYKNTDWKKLIRSLAPSIGVSALFAGLAAWGLKMSINSWWYILMLFAAFFAVVANFNYFITVLKGKIRVSGGSVAHIGFGMMLVGILISNHNQEVISLNKSGEVFTEIEEENRDNMIMRYNEQMEMGDYLVTYVADSSKGIDTYYKVNYIRLSEDKKDTLEQFTLFPHVHFNPKMGMSNNPDTRHYLTRDIYSFVTSVPKVEAQKDSFVAQTVSVGDTFFVAKGFAIVKGIDRNPAMPPNVAQPGDLGMGLDIEINTLAGKQYKALPILLVRGNTFDNIVAEVAELGVKFRIDNIDLGGGDDPSPEEVKFVLAVSQNKVEKFIIMKAIVFPYINALWLGCLVMVAGFVISIIRRRKEGKRHAEPEI